MYFTYCNNINTKYFSTFYIMIVDSYLAQPPSVTQMTCKLYWFKTKVYLCNKKGVCVKHVIIWSYILPV